MTSNDTEETDEACAEVPPPSPEEPPGAAGGGADRPGTNGPGLGRPGSGTRGNGTLARTGVTVGPLAMAGLFLAFSGSALMLDRHRRLRRHASH